MGKFISKAIDDFNQQKSSNKKYSRPYGKWNDRWNIDNVISNAVKYYLIDKILNN